MNAIESPPKTSSRMNRIQKVSKCLRLILTFGFPVSLLVLLGVVMSLTHGARNSLPARASQPPQSQSQADLPAFSPVFGLVQLLLLLFWYRTVVKLLGFFEKGILFTAETVRCLQALGCLYLVGCLLALALHFSGLDAGHRYLLFSDPFTGLFLIFIGWLIDEARKIREEQELTV